MAIKQMTKLGEAFFPKTTTSAVIDEATGKTLDDILATQDSDTYIWEHPEFEVVTQEEYEDRKSVV